ncbi:MAG: retropepsin-like aspartic protease family protein [Gammaproteobacteria bacterium]
MMKLPDWFTSLSVVVPILFLCKIGSPGAVGAVGYRNLADQLGEIADQNNIAIVGLELTVSKAAEPVSGTPAEQIKYLLHGFNYLTTLSSERSIERIIILSEKKIVPRGIVLQTRKKGQNHLVDARVTGPNREQVEVSLVIDTGADYLVLPESMMATFGIDPDSAETRELQTANGVTEARVAKVQSLQIGPETISDIEAAFIEDEQLGDTKLLGMNVLRRYRVTLDDRENTLTLIKIE